MQNNPLDRKILGRILGEISIFEREQYQRPLLSALVVRAGDNYEGDGFYKLVEDLGFGSWKTLKEDGTFEVRQIKECIEFWSDDQHYKLYR